MKSLFPSTPTTAAARPPEPRADGIIYSASRRTDMPAFFPDHIAGRVARARKLAAIVLWTKDIRNLVRHRELAAVTAKVPSVVQFTVTGLAGTAWEPGVPGLAEQAAEVGELSRRLPKGAVRWRFDPVIPWPGEDVLERFRRVRDGLERARVALDGVTVSFPDPYRHAALRSRRAGLAWPAWREEEKWRLLAGMAGCFGGAEAPVRLCCEAWAEGLAGAVRASCVDGGLFTRLYGLAGLAGLEKDPGQRAACGCAKSTDIGGYDMECGHGCRYCYANRGV